MGMCVCVCIDTSKKKEGRGSFLKKHRWTTMGIDKDAIVFEKKNYLARSSARSIFSSILPRSFKFFV